VLTKHNGRVFYSRPVPEHCKCDEFGPLSGYREVLTCSPFLVQS
jgi:hypothetical protein